MKHQRKFFSPYLTFSGVLISLLLSVTAAGAQTVSQQNDRDITRQELASFDGFLDAHSEIAEALRKDPSMVDNQDFVKAHPVLQQYLQDHPRVREEIKENPDAFMRQENRFDRREDDATRRELTNFDRFLDSHPEIAEQLRKEPSLADNRQFVDSHPALQQFLQEHPGVREQLAQNPRIFMNEENRFDRRENSRFEDFESNRDRDTSRVEFASMGRFLESHPAISDQLSKNPSLAKSDEYLENHPELQDYLKNNPGVKEQLSQNPQAFMQSVQKLDNNGTDHKTVPKQMPKTKAMMTNGNPPTASGQNPKQ